VLDFSVGGPDQVGLRLIGDDSDKGQIRDSARVATLDCKLEFQAFGIGRNFSLCASLAQCNERHRSRAKRKHLRRLLRLAPERRTRRQLRAYANDEAAFLRRLDRKASTGALRYFDLRLSTRAQARLQAAYRQYRPPPFHGRAAILSSAERDAAFRDDGQFWSELLPGRKVYRIADTHGEITGPASAKAMQSIFDAAVAEDQAQALLG